jgi:hypothetical protein
VASSSGAIDGERASHECRPDRRATLRAGQACGDAAANRAAVGPPLTGEVQHNGLMKIIRNLAILFALSSVALATSACPEKKGPAEKAGEKIDKAVDKTKDAAKDLTK